MVNRRHVSAVDLNVFPSKKAVGRMRETLRARPTSRQCNVPLPELVADLNRQLTG